MLNSSGRFSICVGDVRCTVAPSPEIYGVTLAQLVSRRPTTSSQWRHNERDSVSNHLRLDCLSGTDQRNHQSSASLAFVRGIHRWPVNSPHKGPVTQKMFPFDDVIMCFLGYARWRRIQGRRRAKGRQGQSYIETEMSSFWWNFHHWQH